MSGNPPINHQQTVGSALDRLEVAVRKSAAEDQEVFGRIQRSNPVTDQSTIWVEGRYIADQGARLRKLTDELGIVIQRADPPVA